MNPEDQSLVAAKALGGRVSVACLPCRSRHVRCDAQQPVCVRCSSEGRTCQYVKSRRGGLNRARLAERRRARDSDRATAGSPSDASAEARSPERALRQGYRATGEHSSTLSQGPSVRTSESEVSDLEGEYGTPNSITDIQFSSVANDFLVKLYYRHFHRCHPCVLPQHKLQQYYDEIPEQRGLVLLVAVMRLIGSLYSCPDLTPQLQDKVREEFQAAKKLAPDPFLAQCHLLYSIALYWSAEKEKAREEIDAAIGIALDLVLEESFRRTWWQLFCIDAYYAAIKRSPTFALCEVDTDADLPCEEDEYESGLIPTPKTLDDFDSREFAPETQCFSSFAYLIGATRSIALALSAGAPDASNWLSPNTIAEVDAIIDGWFLLLPKSKREVVKEGNVVDELMFQAQMAVHANLIALHRPFSRLPFHPLEGVSSCLVGPPKRLPMKDSETAHTQRCLQSIEAQLQFLVLPVQPFRHSPFTICMTAASKVWPQGVKNLDEIQSIAQEVLSRKNESPRRTTPEKASANSQKPLAVDGAPCIEGLDNWINPTITLENPDSLSPYWNFSNDFQPDIPIWFSSY
ncbi:hypothetical protein EKO27_g3771 [Xylaria grammica]|uniref:Zn(2)-C6 fungal-type domain-containing protein n=1 Tax=Xylaria grammica TaxID=363999 RepID=A0A439DA88_9PEZI|nr:hypothetical protein EKO27_g3771 [Xylaria grammica]